MAMCVITNGGMECGLGIDDFDSMPCTVLCPIGNQICSSNLCVTPDPPTTTGSPGTTTPDLAPICIPNVGECGDGLLDMAELTIEIPCIVSCPNNEECVSFSCVSSTTTPPPTTTAPPGTTAGGGGDPHFVSYDGVPFSFHGGCDIDVVESAAACEGAGLRIVIRTTVETSMSAEFSDIGSDYISSPAFSYISSVVVQIGQEEVLEFGGDGSCHLNGELVEAVKALEQVATSTMKDEHEDEVPAASGFVEDARRHADTDPVHALLAGYPVTKGFKGKRGKIVSYELRLDDNRVVHVRARAGILSIDVSGKFDDAKGLLGTSGKPGLLVSRDGHDMTTDWLALGESWQVQSTQPMLFREARFPQHPQQCTYDAAAAGGATAKHGRRLRGIIEAEPVDAEAAAAACAGLTGTMHEWCLSDCLSMGLGMAEDSFFQTYN